MYSWNFDERVDREGTNSLKYDAARSMNPTLPEHYISMWIADMDFACPQPVLDAMKARLDRRILGYSGLLNDNYFDAVIRWEKECHGIEVKREEIVYSAGVVRAMEEAVSRLTKPGDKILINTPGYHPFDDSTKKFGRVPVYSPLKNDGKGYYTFDFEDMEKKAADPEVKLFFLCNPQNPTGRVWTPEELSTAAEICFRHGVFVFCDEIWRDLVRMPVTHTSLKKLFPERTDYLVATAPSKTFNLAGNQLANILIPDLALAAEWRAHNVCGMPNPLSIDATRAAFNDCRDWLAALRLYLDENFRFMDEFVRTELPGAVFCVPEGTYLAWIDLSAYGYDTEELRRRITEAGLFIEYSGEFVADDYGHVRINIACPKSVLAEALGMLKAALQ